MSYKSQEISHITRVASNYPSATLSERIHTYRAETDPDKKKFLVEAMLFDLVQPQNWEERLDAPLIMHAAASLRIQDASRPDVQTQLRDEAKLYSDIFDVMGIPKLYEETVEGKILLIDSGFSTGSTLKEERTRLIKEGFDPIGVYFGLHKWDSILDFGRMWKFRSGGLGQYNDGRTRTLERGFFPTGLRVFTNGDIDGYQGNVNALLNRIVKFLERKYVNN